MRAVAALLVIGSHCHVPALHGGFYGVDLFLVLSGFLITGLLIDEHCSTGSIDLMRFYLRRLIRLTPPLLAMLAVYVIVGPLLWPQFDIGWHVRDALIAAFYVPDYARAFWQMPHIVQHTWSLGVEEHFYLLWPLVLLVVLRLPPRWRPSLLFGLYIAATAWRMYWYDDAADWPKTYFRFDTRMSGLILGALLATVLGSGGRVPERLANLSGVVATGAMVLALALGGWHVEGSMEWTMTLAEFATAALLVAASAPESWVSRLLTAPPLVAIGILSYGMYLWHYPVAVYFRERLPWFDTVPMVLAITFLAATMSHLLIEQPLQVFRRNLSSRSKSKTSTEADGAVAATAPSR